MKLLIVTSIILSSFLIAQNRDVQNEEMKIPKANNPITINTLFVPNSPNSPGEEFLLTDFDYMSNNATRAMIDLVDLDADGVLNPIFTARGIDNSYFGFKAFGVIDKFLAFDSSQAISSPVLQYCEGGPFDGNALIMGNYNGSIWHSIIDLTNFQPILPFPQTTFGSGAPSFVYTPGAIFTTSSDKMVRVSIDGGQTFFDLLMIGDGDPNVDIVNATNSPSEFPIRKSSDGLHIYTVGIFEGAGLVGNPDIVYLYGSSDGGVTWSGSIIGVGSGNNPEYGLVINRDYAPYFANFAQVSLTIDDAGVTHITANGYGEGRYMGGTDTVNVYPMLYWNSRDQQWIAVTPESMEAPDDGFGTDLADHRPGNGIGNSYGSIAVSDDGQLIFLAWQGPEYTGAIGNSRINLFPGDGSGSSTEIFYTDIYHTLSFDGGATWENPMNLQGDSNVMEEFPVFAKNPEFDGTWGEPHFHFIYLEDAIPGVSLFDENSWSDESVWRYETTSLIFDNVENDNIVNGFDLKQNYPNPFNPSTKIKYAISSRQFVTLKVYDVLGKEIATLVNEEKSAGSYEVVFDASKLPSGIYFYTLNAGEFSQTRKMILLK